MILLKNIFCAVGLVLLSGLVFLSIAKPRRLPPKIVDFVLDDACAAGCSTEERATYKRNLKFETKDLNGDKRPEFLVYIDHSDWCGAGSNCGYWVFRRQRNAYRLMLSGYSVVRVLNTVTNGFSDLESQHGMGGCTLPDGSWGRHLYVTVFKYTGKKYVPGEIGEQCRPGKP